MKLKFKLLHKNAKLPVRKHATDSGFDCYAVKDVSIGQFETAVIPLGIACEIPDGYELQLRPRSSLSSDGILSHFGTIDTKYRGEIKAALTNLSPYRYVVTKGDRICQLVPTPVALNIESVEIEELDENTERGTNGFGSTGRV